MGPCTASSCCCQALNLPWGPIPTLMLLPGPVICHGPLYRLPHAAARSRVCHGSLYGPPIAAVSIATLCHVPLSGLHTLLVVSIFVIGCCMGLPIAAASTATLWLHTLVLARDCPNE
ncbi:unnamed protein product [Staurois parvus]|uniref:Uncharacterized protein n=1 Tax=Staurois parvus TaxID=386267 RepID=A0ABN9CY20_9NEOB|nr:unnamed protein product [Staurois parvus]